MNSPAIIKQRRDTAANWTAVTAQPLYDGQLGLEIVKNAQNKLTSAKIKVGDGISTWAELPYLSIAALSDSTTSTQNGYFGDIYLWDDSTPSHYLRITNSADLTAGRSLGINVNDANRTITFSGNLNVSGDATVSGSNSGDQTIQLTGDVTGSGAGTFSTTLSTVNSNVGSFTAANITVDAKGRITAAGSNSLNFLSNATNSTQAGYFGDIYIQDDSNPSHYLRMTLNEDLTKACTLSLKVFNNDKSISLGGDLNLANSFTTAGNFGLTLTTTNTTNATLPSGNGTLVFDTSPTFKTSLVTDSPSFNIFNTVATTINAFGNAETINIGKANTGTTTINHNLAVAGNLTINGTTTTVNSTTVTIDDPIFTLGGDTAPTANHTNDRGIEFRWHDGTSAKVGFFGFDKSASAFTFIPDATNTSETFTGTLGNAAFGAIQGTSGTFSGNISAANFSGSNSGTNTGDQNIFSKVVVSGQSDVTAATTTTALTLVAGKSIELTTNNTSKSVTIAYNERGLWKENAEVATTGEIVLSGLDPIDGIALSAGTRVLVKDQSNAKQNGIYVAAAGAWTRASDFDAISESKINTNKSVLVSKGDINGGGQWSLATETFSTLGNTDLNWRKIAAPIVLKNAGNGGIRLFAGKGISADYPNTTELAFKALSYDSNSGISVTETNNVLSIGIPTSIPLAKGGTGATDVATARANLGVPADGDVVKLTGDQSVAGTKTFSGTVNVAGFLKLSPGTGWPQIIDHLNITLLSFQGGEAVFGNRVVLGGSGTTSGGSVKSIARSYSAGPSISISDTNEDVTVHGALTVNGNVIKSSGGQSTLTLSGNNVTVAGTITGALSGNATTATTLQTARAINGTSFNGSADITITANTPQTLTIGTYLTGSNFNGSAATTWAVDATSANTASKVVARDASGNFTAGTVTLGGLSSSSTTFNAFNAVNGNQSVYLMDGQDQVSNSHAKALYVGSNNAGSSTLYLNSRVTSSVVCNVSAVANATTTYGVGGISAGSYFNTNVFSILDTGTTIVNAFRAATNLTMGATTGTTTIRNNLSATSITTSDRSKFKAYWEDSAAPTISSGTLTIDLNAANTFNVSLNANVTTFTISNVPSGTGIIGFTLILTADGTARTITWPGTVKWAGGTAPTLTSTNGKVDILSFVGVVNNGSVSNWFGFVGGQNF